MVFKISLTVIKPFNSQASLTTNTRSTLCSCIISRASSTEVPSGTVTKRSRGVIMLATDWSRRFSKRKSRLVTKPTTLPSSTTGKPDILRLRLDSISSKSPISISGPMVMGSFTTPLSWRFTLETAYACCSGVIFL